MVQGRLKRYQPHIQNAQIQPLLTSEDTSDGILRQLTGSRPEICALFLWILAALPPPPFMPSRLLPYSISTLTSVTMSYSVFYFHIWHSVVVTKCLLSKQWMDNAPGTKSNHSQLLGSPEPLSSLARKRKHRHSNIARLVLRVLLTELAEVTRLFLISPGTREVEAASSEPCGSPKRSLGPLERRETWVLGRPPSTSPVSVYSQSVVLITSVVTALRHLKNKLLFS